ncbi:molybdopterin-dependent oxidoreductase [Wolinella succinogenes]|uniref:THIOSULFATE REDUCTASE n=1 Tax=Wolinella succinogenes (strain ATCC 29543 / DSM 1740 / CCUG 13145 / JCM 31913 / LMG 7466 / NCTC 11488 / FDC 602W) TaxID=273121 RepID=Q7M9S6_WOLSU|nr:molybdopterin-dependent oxidoreductase [Wolinella succinogenes]CAE09834.1 THIOSULFATE REDUCTASE .-.- [Wolinella succinogenes]VEG82045.1 Sulfur reductase chain A [Wolinella succinogenes]HCZ19451.1 thiosulfate reductase [Helicobacter sp.]
MEIEISRRRFLQGSVALTIVGASSGALAVGGSSGNKTESQEKGERSVATLCEMCVNKCAAIARVKDGKVIKLDPNPLFPKSRNMLCARGNAGIKALYDEDRLKYPLIRAGERGDGKFKRVTWDEAYTYIQEKLVKIMDEEQDNRSAIGFCAGEGMGEHHFKEFNKVFGSSNWLNHSSVCLQSTVSGYTLTIGTYGNPDLANAKYVIMAGANRAEAIVTPDTMDLFKRTLGRGCQLVVIDPRYSHTAHKADLWLPIKAGTDLAFVLALTHVVLSEEIYNKKFVEEKFNGFEEYKAHILQQNYTPEWAEPITGISASDIRKVARDFMACAPQAIYYPGRRTTWAKNDFQLRRAMAIFTALGGGVDVKGGICYGKTLPIDEHSIPAPMYANAKSRIEQNKAAIVGGTGSWVAWRDMVAAKETPYPIRGMFIYKQNPMHCVPNTAKTAQMFKNMDLVVTIDTMPSDTAIMSDVILPECTYLERTDPVKSFGGIEPAIAQRNKVIEPLYETKPVLQILRELTAKLSRPLFENSLKHDEDLQEMIEEKASELASSNPNKGEEELKKLAIEEVFEDEMEGWDISQGYAHSEEEMNEHAVAKYAGAHEMLLKHGVFYPGINEQFKQVSANEYVYYPESKKAYSMRNGQFNTPSKKVECVIPSLASKGIDTMPTWREEYLPKTPAGQFRFVTGRHAQFTQSSTANNALLLDTMSENFIWINKRVAKERGIKFGDLLEISSKAGKTRIKAYPTEKIAPDTVFFVHGFGVQSKAMSRAYQNGGHDSMIIEEHIEPVFGAAAAHETLVEIRKV